MSEMRAERAAGRKEEAGGTEREGEEGGRRGRRKQEGRRGEKQGRRKREGKYLHGLKRFWQKYP